MALIKDDLAAADGLFENVKIIYQVRGPILYVANYEKDFEYTLTNRFCLRTNLRDDELYYFSATRIQGIQGQAAKVEKSVVDKIKEASTADDFYAYKALNRGYYLDYKFF